MPTFVLYDGKTETTHEGRSDYDAIEDRYSNQHPWIRYGEDALRKGKWVRVFDVKLDGGVEIMVDVSER